MEGIDLIVGILYLMSSASMIVIGLGLIAVSWRPSYSWVKMHNKKIYNKHYLLEKTLDTFIGGGVGTAMILKGVDIIISIAL